MQTMTVLPSRLGVGTIDIGGDKCGVLRVVGSGSTAHLGIDIVISLPFIGEAAALLEGLREDLVAERCA